MDGMLPFSADRKGGITRRVSEQERSQFSVETTNESACTDQNQIVTGEPSCLTIPRIVPGKIPENLISFQHTPYRCKDVKPIIPESPNPVNNFKSHPPATHPRWRRNNRGASPEYRYLSPYKTDPQIDFSKPFLKEWPKLVDLRSRNWFYPVLLRFLTRIEPGLFLQEG